MRKLEFFTLEELEEARDKLYRNLESGYDWIERRIEEKGGDTREAEAYWKDLKDQYDAVTEEIRHKIGENNGD